MRKTIVKCLNDFDNVKIGYQVDIPKINMGGTYEGKTVPHEASNHSHGAICPVVLLKGGKEQIIIYSLSKGSSMYEKRKVEEKK